MSLNLCNCKNESKLKCHGSLGKAMFVVAGTESRYIQLQFSLTGFRAGGD